MQLAALTGAVTLFLNLTWPQLKDNFRGLR